MREIKFRGKCIHSGEWVYGNYIHSKRFVGCGNEHRIHDQDTGVHSDVIPETVGQFTGLKDDHDEEVFEHDIVADRWGDIATICYENGQFRLKYSEYNVESFDFEHLVVIGNIHDNLELLT